MDINAMIQPQMESVSALGQQAAQEQLAAAEPLVRPYNLVGAAIALGAMFLGYPRVSLFLGSLQLLDVAGRQLSPKYAAIAAKNNPLSGFVGGMGDRGVFQHMMVPPRLTAVTSAPMTPPCLGCFGR